MNDRVQRRVRRWGAGWGVLLAGLIATAATVALAAPAPSAPASPNEGKADGPELPPPPTDDDGDGPGGDEAGEEAPPELTDDEKQALRMREFTERVAKAQSAADRARFDDAVREYSAALRILPGDPSALLGRANARKARAPEGRCVRRAVKDLLELEKEDPKGTWVEQRSLAIEWMGQCGSRYATRRLRLARELADEPAGSRGRDDEIRVTLAHMLYDGTREGTGDTTQRDAALAELSKYDAECKEASRTPTAAALEFAAELNREAEKLDVAADLYARLAQLHPKAPEAADAARIREEIEFELELRKLDETQGFRPTEAAEAAYERGATALRGKRFETAESELSAAIEESPWFPRAYYLRGITRARLNKLKAAVDDLNTSIRMDRSDYRAQMTLGLIYKKEFAGAEDTEAIRHLSAALRLRPDLYRLHLLLGELHARTDREQAREHYQRFIQLAPLDDPDARAARQALEDLEREIRKEDPLPMPPPAEQSLRFLDPELQRVINEAYLRGTEHEDWDLAEKILLEARETFENEPVVLNELARVVYHQERFGDARRYWEQSLQMQEDQVEVHERLGLLLRPDLPTEAIGHLRRAAELGSLTARFALAELLWEQTQPFDARQQLQHYFAEASDYDLHWDRATVLREEIERRFFQGYLLLGLLLTIIIVIPAWRLWRHYRGASLEQLLSRAPKSFPEVARILSLIRHEILKHNTAFLADVGHALEYDAPDAEARAEVLGKRMFGDVVVRGRKGAGSLGGIYGRFLGYLDELEKVSRAYQVTLNLYRKDPIFRPMIKAFEDLAKWSPSLRRPHRLSGSKRLVLAKTLRRSGDVLGRRAFERLSGLIRELCVTEVDASVLRDVYGQVLGEKQFAEAAIAPLVVSGSGSAIRIFRTDLEDILANVFRNSMRSSILYAEPPVGLGVELVTEIDEITGLGSLAIRIKDRSQEQLSNEMLRGRYVERGMGITVDLLSRYDGAIGVEPEAGWSKAVVLRFFIVEDEPSALPEAAQ